MRKLPPLIELRAFEAVARHLSFKKAAKALNVSPTAISHQIKMLEEYCQCRLFQRRPRPISLTHAGAILFPVIHDGLDEFASSLSSIKENREPQSLKLTTTSSFAIKWLMPRLSNWRNKFPNISLEVIATDSVLDLEVEADVSVRYMHCPPVEVDYVAHELVRDEFIIVCSPEVLPGRMPLRTLSELQGHTLVHTHWSPEDIHAPIWPRWLEHASVFYGESIPIENMKHLTFHEEMYAIDAVLNATGIMVISDILVADEIEQQRLIKAMDFHYPGYGFYITYRKDHPHRPILESFTNWAQGQVKG